MMKALPIPRRLFLGSVLAAGAGPVFGQGRPQLTLLTGSAGGVFAEYGDVLTNVLADKAALDARARPSGGSNDNIRALEKGEAGFGLVNMGPAYDAWIGRMPFDKDGPQKQLRALFAMYETPFSLVALKSRGVGKLADLKGRTVGVGPAGGPGEVFFKGLAQALGLDAKLATGSASELAQRVLSGEIDAFWFGAGLPVGAFVQVVEKGDGIVFGMTDEEVAAFRKAFAYFAPYEIPAGTYRGQTTPLKTAAVWNFVLSGSHVPDDLAYAVTKAALDNAPAIAAKVPAAAGTSAANALANTFLPFHPGAVRYYREKGVSLPPDLVRG